jgi:hypothetical protein
VQRLRTFRRIVPFLIGLFMAAQLAGVVSLEESHGSPGIAAATEHHPADHAAYLAYSGDHHHGHGGVDTATHHGLGGGGVVGPCCALHAFLVAVAPIVLIAPVVMFGRGERLDIGAEVFTGLAAKRLDRPPRSLLSL